MIKELLNIANELDSRGLTKEADYLDLLLKKAIPIEGIFELPSTTVKWEDDEGIELEDETVNKSVAPGDWIIRAMTRAGEEYVVKRDKFPTLYYTEPVGSGPDGFMIYEVRPDDRTGIEISEAFGKVLADNFSDNFPVPQLEFRSWLAENAPKVTVRKQSRVYAKQAEDGAEIVTRVDKNDGAEILSFEAPWGGSMPIKINDILIINKDEVYRIARAEFDQTYQSIGGE